MRATAGRLTFRGAAILGIHDEPSMGQYAIAMQEPEGNEFDVV